MGSTLVGGDLSPRAGNRGESAGLLDAESGSRPPLTPKSRMARAHSTSPKEVRHVKLLTGMGSKRSFACAGFVCVLSILILHDAGPHRHALQLAVQAILQRLVSRQYQLSETC